MRNATRRVGPLVYVFVPSVIFPLESALGPPGHDCLCSGRQSALYRSATIQPHHSRPRASKPSRRCELRMSPAHHEHDPPPRRRLYVVHLLSGLDHECQTCRYVARIRPWATRTISPPVYCERTFADECELIAAVNPLLPRGSDIRDVFGHIESPSGFLYLLRLSVAEARKLGWRDDPDSGVGGNPA